MQLIGGWPSGKAPGFGPGIRGFESLTPSHITFMLSVKFSSFSIPFPYLLDLVI